MSNQRYELKLKSEAVRQVIDKEYSVQAVSQRLGVSAHSAYKWLNAVKQQVGRMFDGYLTQ